MTDPKQITETVARLRTWDGDSATTDEAADLLQSLAAENAALKAEAEASAARLAEVDAERVAQWNLRRDADGSRDAAYAAADTMRMERDSAEAERDRLAAELVEARAVLLDGSRPLPFDREDAGRMVREAWVRWAETQPNPKPSWLVPYHKLSEADKEADRQIGETVARWTLAFDASRAALTTETPA